MPSAKILDMACGRGRHAVYLNEMGFEVTGVDLSESSIAFAERYQKENLHFAVHNIHEPYRTNYFDACLNLFTSFGYEEDDDDNYNVIASAVIDLKPGGYFVLDYLNVKCQPTHEAAAIEKLHKSNVDFTIQRYADKAFIIKSIEVEAAGQFHSFRERIKRYDYQQLIAFYQRAKLEVVGIYGDYEMNEFDPEFSNRTILIGKKDNL